MRHQIHNILLLMATLLSSLSAHAQQRDAADAMSIAQDFMRGKVSAMADGTKGSAKSSVSKAVRMHLMSSGKANAYYVYGMEEGSGFVIVSGDERMLPVLGWSATADVSDMTQMPDNVAFWLGLYEQEYEAFHNADVDANDNANDNVDITVTTYDTSTFSTTAVSPLLTSSWGQGTPFNNDCPSVDGTLCKVGCVATAMSQIMYHYKYPECGAGVVSYTSTTNKLTVSADLSQHPFEWQNMLDSYTGETTAQQQAAVANLCFMAGAAVKMDYGTSDSTAPTNNALTSMADRFGYDPDMAIYHASTMTSAEWHQLLQTELLAGRPVLYTAMDGSVGHAFVLDGYTPPTTDDATPYYDINWGWNGSWNGSYAISSFNAGGYKFTQSHAAICGIQPDDDKQTVSRFEGTSTLSTTSMNASSITKATATLSITNCAYRAFSGTVKINVVKPDGTSETISQFTLSNVANGGGMSNVSASFTPSAGVGTYTIEAYSVATGSTAECKIGLSGIMSLEVLADGEQLPQKTTNLQVTQMPYDESKCTSTTLAVKLYNIRNMIADSFTGVLKLIVADTKGNQLTVVGDGVTITALDKDKTLSLARTLTATIPSDLADGQYRLYAASCQSGYSGWSYIRMYLIGGTIIRSYNINIYRDFWMKDGQVYLSDPFPSGISDVRADDPDDAPLAVYSLDGRRVAADSKGIRIYHYRNGKIVKKMQ